MPRPAPNCPPATAPFPRSGATTCQQVNILQPKVDTVFQLLLEDGCRIRLEDESGDLLLEG